MQKPWNPCLTQRSAACTIFFCTTKDKKRLCFYSPAPHTPSEHDQLCAPLVRCFPRCLWSASLHGERGDLASTLHSASRCFNEMFFFQWKETSLAGKCKASDFALYWQGVFLFFLFVPLAHRCFKKGERERKWMNENPLNLPSSLNVCIVSNCLILPLPSSASCCTCNSRKLPPKLPSLVWDPRTTWL